MWIIHSFFHNYFIKKYYYCVILWAIYFMCIRLVAYYYIYRQTSTYNTLLYALTYFFITYLFHTQCFLAIINFLSTDIIKFILIITLVIYLIKFKISNIGIWNVVRGISCRGKKKRGKKYIHLILLLLIVPFT